MSPCLWFADEAEEAAKYYVGIFKGSSITTVTRYGEAGKEAHGRTPGSVMTVLFELDGQSFMGLNGGQIVPKDINKFYADEKSAGAARTMNAMLKMKKLDMGALQRAFEGKA
ncbi:MAG: VOC family protein [Gemmatimonadaceae bacterium]